MKRIFLISVLALICAGCHNDKKEEKAALDSVIIVHDIVMNKDEQLMKFKTQFTNISKANPEGGVKDSVKTYLARINSADSVMDSWMHKFDPEHKTASHTDNMAYLKQEHEKIKGIDKQLSDVIAQSANYLTKQKK